MKITDAKVFVCCPGRNFVTLKVCTDQGIYGLGDATLNGRELSVASYLQDHDAIPFRPKIFGNISTVAPTGVVAPWP